MVTPSAPQGPGHTPPAPGWPARAAGPTRGQRRRAGSGRVNTASPWKPPGQTSPCTPRLPQHPSPCPVLSSGGRRAPGGAAPGPPRSRLKVAGGTRDRPLDSAPRRKPPPAPARGARGGKGFTCAGPAHAHPRQPPSPARAGPGARGLRGRPAGGCARRSRVGRPRRRLWAGDLAPRPWRRFRGPVDNEAAGPQGERRPLATSLQPGASSPVRHGGPPFPPAPPPDWPSGCPPGRPKSSLGAWLSFGRSGVGGAEPPPRPPGAAGRRLDQPERAGPRLVGGGMGGASGRRGSGRGVGGVALPARLRGTQPAAPTPRRTRTPTGSPVAHAFPRCPHGSRLPPS